MQAKLVAIIVVAVATAFTGPAFAAASDYAFEPVSSELKHGDEAVIAVRLKHKVTGKPVSDAVIFRTRIDMAPDGMPAMDAPLTPVEGSEPGVYAFKTDLPMEGRWLFSIAAKVQGERETVIGRITLRAR